MPWNLTSEMQNVIPEPCYTSLLTARQRLQQLPPGGRKDHLARRSLLGALRNCPANAVVLDEVGEGLRLLGEPAAALAVFRCGARRGLWRHPLQRVTEKETQMQLHSVAVLEDDAMHDFPELQRVHHLVEKHHGRIRMEFLRALQNPRVWRVAASLLPCNHDKLCWEKRKLPHGGVAGRWHIGSWQHFYIMQKTDGEFACAHGLYPHTCRLLEMIEAMGLDLMRAQVSTVKGTPVGFIAAHRSHVQERMRLNCAISVPENSSSVLRFPGYLKKAYQKGKLGGGFFQIFLEFSPLPPWGFRIQFEMGWLNQGLSPSLVFVKEPPFFFGDILGWCQKESAIYIALAF